MPFLDIGEMQTSTVTQDNTSLLSASVLNTSKKLEQDGESLEWLAVSPYSEKPHLLDLSAVEPAQALLARALTIMTPICDDYATAPYTKSFNWAETMLSLKSFIARGNYHWKTRTFFIIVFRSQVKPQTDRSRLGDLDERSHAEAMRSGGLLKYWFGVPDSNYRNLATCIWNTAEEAQRGGRGEGHREAAKTTANMYSEWRVERLDLTIGENADSWSIDEWKA